MLVKVRLSIVSLLALNEGDSSFTIDAFYNISWIDPRLNYKFNFSEIVTLDSNWKSKLWVPDIYFRNSQTLTVLNFFQPIQFFEIRPGNNVTMVVRLNSKLSCNMDLFYYPQDKPQCFIDIVSLTFNSRKLQIDFENFEVDISTTFPKCEVTKYWIENCTKVVNSEKFSCVRGVIRFYRRFSYYFLRIYAPSFLVVIISFAGFWIPVLGWPARVALIVTPLLSLVTMGIQINSEINVSYVVALHIWMMFCDFFVFMCLIEYAIAISYAWYVEDTNSKTTAANVMMMR
ncbi:Glycine receptor subunit alphaZ1-like protein, partial [Dinothrombium tinctorium]